MEAQGSATADPELAALREKWAPAWSIWRARRRDDPPGVFAGEFMATRLQDDAGTDRTIMQPTAERLDSVLLLQARRRARR